MLTRLLLTRRELLKCRNLEERSQEVAAFTTELKKAKCNSSKTSTKTVEKHKGLAKVN